MMILDLGAPMQHKATATGGQPEFFSTQVSEARRFHLDTSGRARQSVTVVCGGCEHCRPGYRIDRSDFPFHSIEFGFRDAFHFSRTFKKVFGESSDAFRKLR